MQPLFITTCITRIANLKRSLCVLLIVFLQVVGCTSKKDSSAIQSAVGTSQNRASTQVEKNLTHEQVKQKTESKNLKKMTYYLKFIGSLEKEILKLVMAGEAPVTNQFEVLAQAMGLVSEVKTEYLAGFDCQKNKAILSGKKIEFFNVCYTPQRKLAEMWILDSQPTSYKVVFNTSQWEKILGSITGVLSKNRSCIFTISDNKVQKLNCKDTSFGAQAGARSSQLKEYKLTTYVYERNAQDEIIVSGSVLRDFLEIKKISVKVPVIGKIKILEKEMHVVDEFADIQQKLTQGEDYRNVTASVAVSSPSQRVASETATVNKASDNSQQYQEEINPYLNQQNGVNWQGVPQDPSQQQKYENEEGYPLPDANSSQQLDPYNQNFQPQSDSGGR